jgi:DNA-binding MarR family transcriptional regulator
MFLTEALRLGTSAAMSRDWKPGDPVPHVHDGVPEALAEAGLTPAAVTALLDFDVANFQWFRMTAKGEMASAILARLGIDLDPAAFHGLTAIIRIGHGVGRPATGATIGLVAEDLSVDPSRASRIVADLVGRGLVRRAAVQADGRKSVLTVTAAGRRVLDAVRREKWQVMAQVFRDWDPATIAHFAHGIRTYTEGVQRALGALGAAPSAPGSGE